MFTVLITFKLVKGWEEDFKLRPYQALKRVLIVVLLIHSRTFKPTNYCLWYQSVSLKKIWWTLDEIWWTLDEIFFSKVSRRQCIKVIFVGLCQITLASE